MNTSRSPKGTPLPATVRERLSRAHETYGAHRVIEATGLAVSTFWRALAGGPQHLGTQLAIERGLDLLEREAP